MADYLFVTETGTVVPDTGDILTQVENEFREVFGSDLIVDPSTPQGVLITAEAASRDAVAKNNAQVANQINPNLAGGVFLDALLALTGVERDAATRSVIPGVTLGGIPNVIIPAGTRAKTGNGDVFELLSAVVLDALGAGSGDFRAVEFGPIAAAPGSLTQIVDGVLGWETVTNPAAATLGRYLQSDAGARVKRRRTLGFQGQALAVAITSAVYNVEGVLSLTYRENVTNAAATIDGVLIDAHSVFVCVDGGSDDDIAAALLEKKSGGCGWTGTTTVNVTEAASGQTYPVKFQRPAEVDLVARVTVKNVAGLTDPTAAVKAAILAYAAGDQEGEPGFVVGASVTSFELGGAIGRAAPGLFVKNLELSDDAGSTWSNEIVIAIDEVARIVSAGITVILV